MAPADSAVVDCPELQSYEGDYSRNVRTCSRQLGADNDVWGTAFAVEDMVAVLDHLDIDRVDMYGDSYGSFFTQAFAVRHPERVRTIVLDATYPVADQDPWYPDMTRAIADSFRTVCGRDPGSAALGGDPVERMRRLADELAEEPLTGRAPTADGDVQEVTIDAPMLSSLAASATFSTSVYRELDAAGRAYLEERRSGTAPAHRVRAERARRRRRPGRLLGRVCTPRSSATTTPSSGTSPRPSEPARPSSRRPWPS